MNVAEAIAEICRAEGIRVVAGIWGQSATEISKALADTPGMKLFYCRQERVLVDICDGFARVSGQPAAMFTDAGPAAATCARTTDVPHLAVAVADLGARVLGGVAWATLQRAGLVDEHTAGAVARADALFRPERLPYCGTDF